MATWKKKMSWVAYIGETVTSEVSGTVDFVHTRVRNPYMGKWYFSICTTDDKYEQRVYEVQYCDKGMAKVKPLFGRDLDVFLDERNYLLASSPKVDWFIGQFALAQTMLDQMSEHVKELSLVLNDRIP